MKLTPQVRLVEREMSARKWRREDLAYHSGLSFRTIEEIFSGRRPLTLASAVRIARAFGVPSEPFEPTEKGAKR